MKKDLALWVLCIGLVLSFSSPGVAQMKPEEILKVGIYREVVSFDPHTASLSDMNSHLKNNIYQSLIDTSDVDPNDFRPVLSRSWKISGDGLTFTFQLEKGVRFDDGTAFNAQAVKFNFDRLLALKKGGAYDVLKEIERITVKGEDAIEIKFKELGPLIQFLAHAYMVSPSAVKKHSSKEDPWAEGWLANHTAGTGPYKLDEWTKGVRYRLVENPYYWAKRGKHFKAVDCRVIYEVDVQRLMLEKGDLDIAMSLPFDSIPALKKNPNVRIYENVSPSAIYLIFNYVASPTSNLLVRKALAHAWNHEAYSVVRSKMAPRADGPVPSIMLGKDYKPPFQYDYDLKKAKDYLTQAGFGGGLTINFLSQKGDEEKKMVFDIFQNDLAKIGVKVHLFEKTFAGMVETMKNKDLMFDPKNAMHIVSMFITPAPFTPWRLVYRFYATEARFDKSGGQMNVGYYSNPKLDDHISKAMASADPKKAMEFWRKANEELVRDYAAIPIISRMMIVGMRKDIQGYKFRPHFGVGTCMYYELSRG